MDNFFARFPASYKHILDAKLVNPEVIANSQMDSTPKLLLTAKFRKVLGKSHSQQTN